MQMTRGTNWNFSVSCAQSHCFAKTRKRNSRATATTAKSVTPVAAGKLSKINREEVVLNVAEAKALILGNNSKKQGRLPRQ